MLVKSEHWSLFKETDITCSLAASSSSLQSLKSRGFVKEQFAWRTYYWYLTNEGIQYLRDYLHLPPEIVPSTLKRQQRADARPSRPAGGAGRGGPMGGGEKMDGDRAAYRRAPATGDKAGAAGPGSAPMEFRGGFGRGKPE